MVVVPPSDTVTLTVEFEPLPGIPFRGTNLPELSSDQATPEAILPRLEDSLGLLTGGSRDLPDRLQTLRATIAWSHDLLTEGARRLLAACSVVAGGASLEAIETVCDAAVDTGLPVLDGLQELADQSLLRQVPRPGPVRYAMLETIREYAAERLAAMLKETKNKAEYQRIQCVW